MSESLRSLLVDFLKNNPYMFDFGGEITDPSTQFPSAVKPSVIVKTTQCQFVENISWAVENDYETDLPHTFTEMLKALDEDISYGSYIVEDGGNALQYWDEGYSATEADAIKAHQEWLQSTHGKNETRRLAFLRAIRQEVSA
tara:strand:- start:488 stop:913 length:426 start_codon:yes stop_codon:yes gene_type:complete